MTFETKRIEVPSGSTLTEIVDERMAEMSADGWELVAVVGSAATHYLYYQREAAATADHPLKSAMELERVMAKAKKGKADV